MKILCETTGSFQLVDYDEGALVIQAHRPTVARNSHFVSGHAAAGRIRVLGNVNDEATDAEFASYVKDSDGDLQLAIPAFLEAFGVTETSSKITTDSTPEVNDDKPKRGRRAKSDATKEAE